MWSVSRMEVRKIKSGFVIYISDTPYGHQRLDAECDVNVCAT